MPPFRSPYFGLRQARGQGAKLKGGAESHTPLDSRNHDTRLANMESTLDPHNELLVQHLQRQFRSIRDIGIDASALTALTQTALSADASALINLATEADEEYLTATDARKGVLLSAILAILMKLFELGHKAETAPHELAKDPDDPVHYFSHLMPSIRCCIKFVSDEIAVLARKFVQSEEGVKKIIAADLYASERDVDQIDKDRKFAQSLHDRDAAYAAARGFPPAAGLTAAARAADPAPYGRAPPGVPEPAPGVIPAATVPTAAQAAAAVRPPGSVMATADLDRLLREVDLGLGAADALAGGSRGGRSGWEELRRSQERIYGYDDYGSYDGYGSYDNYDDGLWDDPLLGAEEDEDPGVGEDATEDDFDAEAELKAEPAGSGVPDAEEKAGK